MSARKRVARVAAIWWAGVSSGGFFNRWSTLLSFVGASLVSVPTIDGASPIGYAMAVAVAMSGWVLLAALAAPAVVAERRLRAAWARGLVVLATLLLLCGIRTPLNDALSEWMWGIPSEGAFGPRITSNIVTGIALFSVVCMARALYSERRATSVRLETALARMHERLRAAQDQAFASAAVLAAVADRLGAARERMLAGVVDFDTVRAYADEVRRHSHSLEQEARDVDAAPAAVGPVAVRLEDHRSLSDRLVPTPPLAVALVYWAASLPFTAAAGGIVAVVVGLIGVCAIDALAGVLQRTCLPARGAPARPPLFLLVWIGTGAIVAGLTIAVLPQIGMLVFVGLIAIPAVAITLSLCVDAFQSARAAQDYSARMLALEARHVADARAQASDPLRRAAMLLHGRVQGRCVILAAHADEHPPTPVEIAEFRVHTDEAFDRMRSGLTGPALATGPVAVAIGPLDRILAAWRAVIEVSMCTASGVHAALQDTATAERIADIVNEALVNAVKHSSAQRAAVDLDLTAEGRVRVRVKAPGALSPSSERADGLGNRHRDVRISQANEDVLLEALVPAEGVSEPR